MDTNMRGMDDVPDDSRVVICLQCDMFIPEGRTICPVCGWTYSGNSEEIKIVDDEIETGESAAEAELETSDEDYEEENTAYDTETEGVRYEDYCPYCLHFSEQYGSCSEIHENVRDFPQRFVIKCNSKYYTLDESKKRDSEMDEENYETVETGDMDGENIEEEHAPDEYETEMPEDEIGLEEAETEPYEDDVEPEMEGESDIDEIIDEQETEEETQVDEVADEEYKSPETSRKEGAVLVACVDSRFFHSILDFAEKQFGLVYPLLIPGGIGAVTVELMPKPAETLRRQIKFIVKEAGMRNIVLVSHDDCKWYHSNAGYFRKPQPEQQISDVLHAKEILEHNYADFDDLEVFCFHAKMKDDSIEIIPV